VAWDDCFTARDYDHYMGYDDQSPEPEEPEEPEQRDEDEEVQPALQGHRR